MFNNNDVKSLFFIKIYIIGTASLTTKKVTEYRYSLQSLLHLLTIIMFYNIIETSSSDHTDVGPEAVISILHS